MENIMIRNLQLTNYRCFESLQLNFNRQFTVLVGNNGSGKTSVMDALSLSLASYFLGMEGYSTGSITRNDVYSFTEPLGNRLDRVYRYPAKVRCRGRIFEEEINWERELISSKGSTTYGGAKELKECVSEVYTRAKYGAPEIILPVLAYYGTGRLWAKKQERKNTEKLNFDSRFLGYKNCLDPMSNDSQLKKWLKSMTYLEIQEQMMVSELEAVKEALVKCFNTSGNQQLMGIAKECRYSVKSDEIEIIYETCEGRKEICPFSNLSDGYRNMLGLVADIAYRMAVLNPQLFNEVLTETGGVILIDEIDLHLHPAWQRTIVRSLKEIFPKVQFIVSSHSPIVISSVESEELIILEQGSQVENIVPTYGKESDDILQSIMNVPSRQDDVLSMIDNFYKTLEAGEYSEAEAELGNLKDVLGEDDPTTIKAETALNLESMEIV